MAKRLFAILMALAVAAALAVTPMALAGGPPDDDEPVEAVPVEGKPVKVNGRDMKLWVFVHPENPGKGAKPPADPPAYCTDGDQDTTVPKFANVNPNGLTFNINDGSIPINKKTAAINAIKDSFGAWDSVVAPGKNYFAVNNTGGAARPAADGNNTVGWVSIVPRTVLAAAWVWVDDATGAVDQADIYYNNWYSWGVFTACNAESKYEVGDVGTHEVGHVVALDHLKDPDAYATMYPSAAKGETRKRTLTTGDSAGYTAAGGY